jgi:hypothetical protein
MSNEKLFTFLDISIFFFVASLHPRSFEKFKFKFEKFKNNFPCINDFKLKLCQQVSCITLLGLELFFSLFLHPRSFEKFKFKMWKNLKHVRNRMPVSLRGGGELGN